MGTNAAVLSDVGLTVPISTEPICAATFRMSL